MSIVRTASTFLLFTSLLALSSSAFSADSPSPSNTGEVELQQLVRDANKHDVDQYPYGEIECEIIRRNVGGPAYNEISRSHMWWDGDQSRLLVDQTTEFDSALVKSENRRKGMETSHLAYEQIIDREKMLTINNEARKAIVQPRDIGSLPPHALVSPRHWWFGQIGGSGRFWYEVLGPYPTMPQDRIKSYNTKKLVDEQIEIERIDVDGRFRAVASALTWKLLSCEYIGRSAKNTTQVISYKYTWDDSTHTLKEFTYKSTGGPNPGLLHSYKVHRLDVSRRPNANMFSTSESRVPGGYQIEDRIAKKTYMKGPNAESLNVNAQLAGYAKRLRENGFLARKK